MEKSIMNSDYDIRVYETKNNEDIMNVSRKSLISLNN